MDCEFIKYEAIDLADSMSRTIGLFVDHERNDNECLKVIHDTQGLLEDDRFFKTGKSMIILSLIGGFCAGCMVTFEFFCCRVCCAVLLENLAYLGAVVTGALSFLAYHNIYCDTFKEKFDDVAEDKRLSAVINTYTDENYECRLGQGSTYNVCAITFYLCAVVVLCCSPKPTPLIHQMRK